MLVKSLQEKTVDELRAELISLLQQQFNLRMQHATGQLKNNSQLKVVRRSVAQVKTIIRQKVSK